ncbi:hypothetical protein BH18VER1_BH18VER1_21890 [soil metagenome]
MAIDDLRERLAEFAIFGRNLKGNETSEAQSEGT